MEHAALYWWVATGALVVLELLSGTFYLLVIACATAAGGIAHLVGLNSDWTVLIAALVALLGFAVVRRSRLPVPRRDPQTDRDVNLDIGQTLEVTEWRDGRARVNYRGAFWDVELLPGQSEAARWYQIRELSGNILRVGAKSAP
jgi:membrane protein implicated in regulation of membrane protease activity